MDLPEFSDKLERELSATRDELDQLEQRDTQLESALRDVEHDLRRCGDALERSGWRSVDAEARNALLVESRGAIVDDREKIRARRVQLTERLAVIRRRLAEADPDG